jgi:hypothetical protein
MPQGKGYTYDIDTPHGKFTITSDRELPDQDLVSAAHAFVAQERAAAPPTVQEAGDTLIAAHRRGALRDPRVLVGVGAVRSLTDTLGGMKDLASQIPGALKDVATNLFASPETAGATVRGGFEGAKHGVRTLTSPAELYKATTGDVDQNEPALVRAGRVGGTAMQAYLGGKAFSGAKAGVKAVRGARAATQAGRTEAEIVARGLAGDVADETVAAGLGGPPRPPAIPPANASSTGTGARPPVIITGTGQPIRVSPLETTATATGGRVPARPTSPMPQGFGTTPMGIPGAVPMTPGTGFSMPPRVASRPSPANAGGRLAAESPRPAAPPPTTNPVAAIEDALGAVRDEPAIPRLETKGGPPEAGRFKLPQVKDPEAKLAAAEKNGIGGHQPITDDVYKAGTERRRAAGQSPTGTERRAPAAGADAPAQRTLADEMKDAASRRSRDRAPVAGKALDDFVAQRYGDRQDVDLATLAKDLRDEFGSERAARMLGMTRDEVKQLAPGPSKTPGRARDAIAEAERKDRTGNEKGSVNPKILFPVAGAAAGSTYAATGKNPDDSLGRGVLGALTGAALGGIAMNPMGAVKIANRARIEGMLSGAAIPKNLATAAGSAVTSAVEGTGRTRLAPLTEMFNPVRNTKEFVSAWKNPTQHQTGHVSGAHQRSRSVFAPSRIIGAVDETAQRALRRAGVGEDDIQRMLLTADNDLSALTGKFGDAGHKVGQALIPFQRTPANAVREGFREIGRLGDRQTGVGQKALTAASIPAGAAIGEWAKQDPKRRGTLAAILIATMGSRALPATMAAMSRAGQQVVGGVSPVPEMAFNPRAGLGFPPAGIKLWQRLAGRE